MNSRINLRLSTKTHNRTTCKTCKMTRWSNTRNKLLQLAIQYIVALQVEKCCCTHLGHCHATKFRCWTGVYFFQLATTKCCCVTMFEVGGNTCNNAFQKCCPYCRASWWRHMDVLLGIILDELFYPNLTPRVLFFLIVLLLLMLSDVITGRSHSPRAVCCRVAHSIQLHTITWLLCAFSAAVSSTRRYKMKTIKTTHEWTSNSSGCAGFLYFGHN